MNEHTRAKARSFERIRARNLGEKVEKLEHRVHYLDEAVKVLLEKVQ